MSYSLKPGRASDNVTLAVLTRLGKQFGVDLFDKSNSECRVPHLGGETTNVFNLLKDIKEETLVSYRDCSKLFYNFGRSIILLLVSAAGEREESVSRRYTPEDYTSRYNIYQISGIDWGCKLTGLMGHINRIAYNKLVSIIKSFSEAEILDEFLPVLSMTDERVLEFNTVDETEFSANILTGLYYICLGYIMQLMSEEDIKDMFEFGKEPTKTFSSYISKFDKMDPIKVGNLYKLIAITGELATGFEVSLGKEFTDRFSRFFKEMMPVVEKVIEDNTGDTPLFVTNDNDLTLVALKVVNLFKPDIATTRKVYGAAIRTITGPYTPPYLNPEMDKTTPYISTGLNIDTISPKAVDTACRTIVFLTSIAANPNAKTEDYVECVFARMALEKLLDNCLKAWRDNRKLYKVDVDYVPSVDKDGKTILIKPEETTYSVVYTIAMDKISYYIARLNEAVAVNYAKNYSKYSKEIITNLVADYMVIDKDTGNTVKYSNLAEASSNAKECKVSYNEAFSMHTDNEISIYLTNNPRVDYVKLGRISALDTTSIAGKSPRSPLSIITNNNFNRFGINLSIRQMFEALNVDEYIYLMK